MKQKTKKINISGMDLRDCFAQVILMELTFLYMVCVFMFVKFGFGTVGCFLLGFLLFDTILTLSTSFYWKFAQQPLTLGLIRKAKERWFE